MTFANGYKDFRKKFQKISLCHFSCRMLSAVEIDSLTVIKEILNTAQSGVRGLSEEKIRYYNLDAIISVGYRS